MKYSDTLREFLTDYLHQELEIVTKVGTTERGFLQHWNETDIVIATCLDKDKSQTIINLKDIVSITETDVGGKINGVVEFGETPYGTDIVMP